MKPCYSRCAFSCWGFLASPPVDFVEGTAVCLGLRGLELVAPHAEACCQRLHLGVEEVVCGGAKHDQDVHINALVHPVRAFGREIEEVA